MEATDTTLKIECSHCGQHILVDQSYSGTTDTCPTCNQTVEIPAFVPPTTQATKPQEPKSITPPPPPKQNKSALAEVHGFICGFCGLNPLRDFQLSHLFSEAFQRRSRTDIDAYFNCGCPRNTPDIADVPSEWPRPWFFWRMLVFGLVVLIGFCFALESFHNPKMVPGLIIVGAFFVPLACVTLFFEFNVLRNISLYQLLKFIVGGGIVSLIIALFLFSTTGLHRTFLGATAAGIVEEIAKAFAAVFLIRGTLQYRWILNGLLVGAAVGAGFAGFESAGYMFEAIFQGGANDEGVSAFYRTLVIRAIFAPFCHVVWTASVVGALWRVKQDQPFQVSMFFHKDFLRVLAFVMLLHMLWNSGLLWAFPRNAVLLKGEYYLWLISIIGSWYLALLLIQEGLLQVKLAKQIT
ncbi:MAG: PrsW family glutamic-type intramembrane protease [Prosthecobacter sp.]